MSRPLLAMLKLGLSALGSGLVGAIVVPLVAFFGSLLLFHMVVPQCGSPGESGGCEMSAAMIGLGAAIPGFFIGAGLGLYLRHRRDRPPAGLS